MTPERAAIEAGIGSCMFGVMSAGATQVFPWDIDAPLKLRRLLLIARLAVETRRQAIAEANRDLGDTNWGIGCKAHERFAHAVTRLAETTEKGWLRVHRDGLSFVSFVEGIAVRAYHGAADRPQARHVWAAQVESRGQQAVMDPRQMAFDFGAAEVEPATMWAWLMAVETDDEGRALRVVFFQANAAGATRNAWVAPIEEMAGLDAGAGAAASANANANAKAGVGRRKLAEQVALV
jgi:hypothetical protein